MIPLFVERDAIGARRLQLRDQRARVEHIAPRPFGPLTLDQAEDLHLVEIRESR
jgi:hypothetical protein